MPKDVINTQLYMSICVRTLFGWAGYVRCIRASFVRFNPLESIGTTDPTKNYCDKKKGGMNKFNGEIRDVLIAPAESSQYSGEKNEHKKQKKKKMNETSSMIGENTQKPTSKVLLIVWWQAVCVLVRTLKWLESQFYLSQHKRGNSKSISIQFTPINYNIQQPNWESFSLFIFARSFYFGCCCCCWCCCLLRLRHFARFLMWRVCVVFAATRFLFLLSF